MRYSGLAHPQEQIPVLPDTTLALLLTAASVQAFDWPANANLVRITAGSTLAVSAPVVFNPGTTSAFALATSASISSSVGGQQILITPGESRWYQIPSTAVSTGFSVICGSSNSVGMEFWSKHG